MSERDIQKEFEEFHARNPHVYEIFVKWARYIKSKGRRASAGLIFERMRFDMKVETDGEPYKLNNNFRSRYARLAMEQEPDLADFFETRDLRNIPENMTRPWSVADDKEAS